MEYFAGLDISMKETHICVMDRHGKVILEAKAATLPAAIATELTKAPAAQRIVFETGRMATTLYHGLVALGLPVACIESRHAYQALKSLATHKTDRNDARGLAHLARTGFYKPVHVKSLPAHAVRALIIARKKLVGQRVTLENQIRGLAVVFGVRLPTCVEPCLHQAGAAGQRRHPRLVCSDAGSGCGACRRPRRRHGDRRGHQKDGQGIRLLPSIDEHSRCWPTDRTCLRGRS